MNMDDIDTILTRIIERVNHAGITETEKADVYAQLAVGMRRLIWPILLVHVPEYLLQEAKEKKELTLSEYTDIVDSAMQNPKAGKDMYDELKGALLEVDALVTKRLG